MIDTPFFPRLQRLLAVLALTVMGTALLVNWQYPYAMDFLSFWAAGKLTAAGQAASAYDLATHQAVHAAAVNVDAKLPFGYPPFFLFAIAPFGTIAYMAAAPLWVAGSLAAYALAVRRLAPDFIAVAIAFPPVAICAILGQSGLFVAALFMAAMALLPSRPWLAGVLIGCIAIKPQIGIFIPLALLAGKEWRTFAGAAITVAGLAVASLAAFGWGAWQGFFAQAELMSTVATANAVGWQKMASIYTSLRLMDAPDALAWTIHTVFALLGAIFVWQGWRKVGDPLTRAAILAPATLLVSPYLYTYDQTLLIVSLIWLAKRGVHPGLLAGLFALPLVQAWQFGNANAAFNVAPVLTVLLLVLVRIDLEDDWPLRRPWAPIGGRLHRRDRRIAQNSR